jgi:methylglutaconyl-CoA hydratase
VGALRVVRDGQVLRVTLAKPERRNAFDAGLIAELTEAFSDIGDARVVVLEGEGPSFCAGADVEWQRAAIELSYDENVEDAMRLYAMLEAVDSCPAPVVCCVHGFALGGGSGLVACADAAVAWPDAVFGFTEVRLGIIPAVISPFVLANDILAGGPIAVRAAKKLVRERPTGIDTAHIAAARRTSEEGQDGLRAFLDRRPAGWIDDAS